MVTKAGYDRAYSSSQETSYQTTCLETIKRHDDFKCWVTNCFLPIKRKVYL